MATRSRPGVVSTDSRSAAMIAEWEASGLAASVASRVQQRIWPGQSTALMAWFSRYEPETLPRTANVLYCKDFLRAKLTGDRSTDPTDGGIGGVIDVEKGAYVPGVFEDLGIAGLARPHAADRALGGGRGRGERRGRAADRAAARHARWCADWWTSPPPPSPRASPAPTSSA